MALAYIDDDVFGDIADAIRNRNGTNNTYKPSEMATAIRALRYSAKAIVNIDIPYISGLPVTSTTGSIDS